MFIRGFNPIWFEVDLTAKAFDDTFYMFVLQNTIPYLPATVYHTSTDTPWTNPIRFLANGTLPIDIFFDPGTPTAPLVYRLEFRKGPTQSDPLIYLVENYIPGSGAGNVTSFDLTTDNQITNPQFSLINFVSPYTVIAGSAQTVAVAPGWDLVLTGTGNFTLTQVPLNSTVVDPTNAPYALRITVLGWDSVILRQRFQQNGVLWANKTVSTAITARLESTSGSNQITVNLVDSMGAPVATLISAQGVDAAFNEYKGSADLTNSTNTNIPPVAFIDYQIILPSNIDIYLTSIQVVSGSTSGFEPGFEQDTIDRQIDHTFHYYKPQLIYKPIPSYLIGWDFGFNPCQALGRTVAPIVLGGPNLSRYIADQTIIFSSVDNSIGTGFTDGGMNFSTGTSSSFAFIQYLDGPTVRELLNERLAVQLQGFSNTSIPCVINLYWTQDADLPDLTANTSLVAGISSTGVQTVSNGTWNKITRDNKLGDVSFNLLNSPGNIPPTYSFNGWNATDDVGISTATYFAIVVSFGTLIAANQILLRYVSLCAGDIATRPAPLTVDEVLAQCQYYYESSKAIGVPLSTSGAANALIRTMRAPVTGGTTYLYTSAFGIEYKTVKSSAPNVTLYSEGGASNDVTGFTWNGASGQISTGLLSASSLWNQVNNGTKAIQFVSKTSTNYITVGTAATQYTEAFISFHYEADARLGIV